MRLSIHQPGYFPWVGLLHKIAKSDVYMVMDEVQLSDSAYQNRNLFLTNAGEVKYLTIPFDRRSYLGKSFRELEIAGLDWRMHHRNFIYNNYRKHTGFKEVFPSLELYFEREYSSLLDAVFASMTTTMEFFGIGTKVIFQSEMKYDRAQRKGDLVLDLIRAAGADIYLSGSGSRDYLDEAKFGIDVRLEYDVFRHPVYEQQGAPEFVPGLSGLDVLFNLGIDGARSLLYRAAGP
jgi:hypothetical protein